MRNAIRDAFETDPQISWLLIIGFVLFLIGPYLFGIPSQQEVLADNPDVTQSMVKR